jgi:hypothetical protein
MEIFSSIFSGGEKTANFDFAFVKWIFLCPGQGDRMGRIFAYCAIVYFG